MNPLRDPRSRLTQHLLDSGAFQRLPMRIADVGVRGGLEERWSKYGGQIHLIGFDPDAAECERLHRHASPLRTESYYPVALYRDKSIHTLHITQNLAASSLLEPNLGFVDRFPQSAYGAVTATAQIQTTDLDSFAEENHIDYIDFLKIDVEGAELALLEGAQRTLSQSLLGLSVEVFFQEYRIGEPSFADVDQYLRRSGFAFFDFLQTQKWRRKALATDDPESWYGGGQLIWGEALYFRDLAAEMLSPGFVPDRTCRIKVLKLASLAELFDCPDFAAELLQNAVRIGVLDEGDVDSMVRLLVPLEDTVGAREKHRHHSLLAVVKRATRGFVPTFCRRRVRHLLQAILSA